MLYVLESDSFTVSDLEALIMNHGVETSASLSSVYSGRLSDIDISEEKMRRKLRFFFMNPIEKWRAKRRFPYKFVVQVIKIILVTVQVRWCCQ
jgi:mucolipin